jgi:hypothetical protein
VKKCEGIAAMRPFLLLSLALVLSSRASAEPVKGFEANAEVRMGAATAPFFTDDFPEAKGRGGALLFGGSWHAKNRIGFGLMVPLVLVRLDEPDRLYTDEPAWGNPLFSVEGRLLLAREPHARVDGVLRLGVGAPLADHGPPPSLSKSRALAIADALGGWQDRELFAPGMLPFTVTTGVELEEGLFRGEGSVKLAPMVRINDADLPEGTPRDFAFYALAKLGGSIWVFPELGIGAFASLGIDAASQVRTPSSETLQFVVAPSMSFRIGSHVRLETEFVIPVAGALGGSTYGLGLHAGVGW